MRVHLALAAAALLVLAAPTAVRSVQLFEGTHASPGTTANLPTGPTTADIDLDADAGGGLSQGATEIELRPSGSLVFVDFACELPGCSENADYVFLPGDAASGGRVVVSDRSHTGQNGTRDIGQLAVTGSGGVELVGCNYIGANGVEGRCDPFTIATLPEPGTASGLVLGAIFLLALRRRV